MKTVCKNTGKEPSPKGLGYCAKFEKIGTKKKGRDGNIWIIQKRSDGSRAWIKNKTSSTPSVSRGKTIKAYNASKWDKWCEYISVAQCKIYSDLITVSKILNENGINVFICLWQKRGAYYDAAEPFVDLGEKYDSEYIKKKYIIIAFKMVYGKFVKLDTIYLQHTLKKRDEPIVSQIMHRQFGSLYRWNGSDRKAIAIDV
jgi:hypothetical protein